MIGCSVLDMLEFIYRLSDFFATAFYLYSLFSWWEWGLLVWEWWWKHDTCSLSPVSTCRPACVTNVLHLCLLWVWRCLISLQLHLIPYWYSKGQSITPAECIYSTVHFTSCVVLYVWSCQHNAAESKITHLFENLMDSFFSFCVNWVFEITQWLLRYYIMWKQHICCNICCHFYTFPIIRNTFLFSMRNAPM